MPIVTIQAREIPTEKKRELVDKITALVSETYGLPAETITVLIHELPGENIGVAGCLLADRR
ncbi:MAG: 4-oxalocrotonate tautomerase family protein [candidate division WS1 bacterium]|jgi:4-oxalocrotonate tautomerase|nr:4-oxalocrotonate tautomerase family protein [candidate division WS1 bacterium]